MKICVFGSGYVGLVQSVALANSGNDVVCVDIDEDKVAKLNQGISPIYEIGLTTKLNEALGKKQLKFTTDAAFAIQNSKVIFIAVGTPENEDGSANLNYIKKATKTIAKNLENNQVIVNKSTVPVGTLDLIKTQIYDYLTKNNLQKKYFVASNPEFLQEGNALLNFQKPDRIIIGTESKEAREVLFNIYIPFVRNKNKILIMSPRSAELTKYAANCMLATKISFINEIANFADKVGADIEDVRSGIGEDPRIGFSFIYPGAGFGGSCFPKDVKALINQGKNLSTNMDLLKSVDSVNNSQKNILFKKISKHYLGNLKGKTFALWGLSFKPKTDDIREAPSINLIDSLLEKGAFIKAYDPKAILKMSQKYNQQKNITFIGNKNDALDKSDALIICTEWQEFRAPDFEILKTKLTQSIIFDGRNLYNPKQLKQAKFTYYTIGRDST